MTQESAPNSQDAPKLQRPEWRFSGRRGTPVHLRDSAREAALPTEVVKAIAEMIPKAAEAAAPGGAQQPAPAQSESTGETASASTSHPVAAASVPQERRNRGGAAGTSPVSMSTPESVPAPAKTTVKPSDQSAKQQHAKPKSKKKRKKQQRTVIATSMETENVPSAVEPTSDTPSDAPAAVAPPVSTSAPAETSSEAPVEAPAPPDPGPATGPRPAAPAPTWEPRTTSAPAASTPPDEKPLLEPVSETVPDAIAALDTPLFAPSRAADPQPVNTEHPPAPAQPVLVDARARIAAKRAELDAINESLADLGS